jgi:hypothetical protein
MLFDGVVRDTFGVLVCIELAPESDGATALSTAAKEASLGMS